MRKEVKIYKHEGRNILVVDNEAFDWGIEDAEWKKAEFSMKNDPLMHENYRGNIKRYFVWAFGEFIGKEVTLKEINDAIEQEYIEV